VIELKTKLFYDSSMEWAGFTGVSLERMQTFVRVVHAGSIAKAAEGDPAKQALYSRQISELQRGLGLELAHKVGRELQATEAGKRMAVLIAGFLQAIGDEIAILEKEQRVLRLGCGVAVTKWFLQPDLSRLIKDFPSHQIELHGGSTLEVLESLRDGRWDLGIVHHKASRSGLDAFPYKTMKFGLFYPSVWGKRFESQLGKTVTAVDLVTLLGQGSHVTEIANIAEKWGIRWKIAARTSSLPEVMEFAHQNKVAAFLPLQAAGFLTGFNCMNSPRFDGLAREYHIIFDPRKSAIRPVIARAAQHLSTKA
jgi:DNA-binding transcriptional LysR family regulator